MTAPAPRGSADAIDAAAQAVARGEVIAVATDTVYGLACDPANAAAVERVYAIKRRPASLELTLLAADAGDLDGLVRWNGSARRLAAAFWPGALSLVLPVGPRRTAVPRHGQTISARVPDHARLRTLLARTGPLASTSANRHGAAPLRSVAALRREFGTEIGAVLAEAAPPWHCLHYHRLQREPPRVLREGPIDSHRLREFVQG